MYSFNLGGLQADLKGVWGGGRPFPGKQVNTVFRAADRS